MPSPVYFLCWLHQVHSLGGPPDDDYGSSATWPDVRNCLGADVAVLQLSKYGRGVDVFHLFLIVFVQRDFFSQARHGGEYLILNVQHPSHRAHPGPPRCHRS